MVLKRQLYHLLVAIVLTIAGLSVPRQTDNFGPQGHIARDGRDIHRHDFIDRFGLPFISLQRFWVSWWAYTPTRIFEATLDDRKAWIDVRIADARQSRLFYWRRVPGETVEQEIRRYQLGLKDQHWRIRWGGLLANFALALVFVEGVTLLHSVLRRYRQHRRRSAGLCLECGYDLRGSTAFGRCPECGQPFDVAGIHQKNHSDPNSN